MARTSKKVTESAKHKASKKVTLKTVETVGSIDAADVSESEAALEEEQMSCPHCGIHDKKIRTDEEKKALMNRLKRAEGQVKAIEKMIENDAYCPDVIMQSSAAINALNSFNKALLACHIKNCVADDIRAGNDATIGELTELVQKLMK